MAEPIEREELKRLITEEGAQLVDVLPAREFNDSHLPGAINIPLKQLDQKTTSMLRRDKPVVVY